MVTPLYGDYQKEVEDLRDVVHHFNGMNGLLTAIFWAR